PVPKKSEQLFRIALAFRNTHPKDVDRYSEFLDLGSRALVCDRVTPVGADDEIGINVTLAFGRFRPRTGNAVAFEKKIDNFVLEVKREGRKLFRFSRKEVQKIPLRHKTDELA